MNSTKVPTDIWARRDKTMPRRAKDFQVHHPGTYSRKRELDDNALVETELNRRESLAAQIRTYGSLRTL